MSWNLLFFVNSVLFGVGLAMDAFSVSLANGLREPSMPFGRMGEIAGTFAVFQTLMPLAGWFCVRSVEAMFSSFQRFVPWIALILLLYLGGKMILESRRENGETEEETDTALGRGSLLLQGIATSIDALSVGFTIADLPLAGAFAEALIIGAVTFGICMAGLRLGKRFGTRIAGRAGILGGVILIAIGLEIFLKGVL